MTNAAGLGTASLDRRAETGASTKPAGLPQSPAGALAFATVGALPAAAWCRVAIRPVSARCGMTALRLRGRRAGRQLANGPAVPGALCRPLPEHLAPGKRRTDGHQHGAVILRCDGAGIEQQPIPLDPAGDRWVAGAQTSR